MAIEVDTGQLIFLLLLLLLESDSNLLDMMPQLLSEVLVH